MVASQEELPTVFAKCPSCCRTGRGVVVGDYYSKAYTKRKWAQGQVCENCSTPMKYLYEVRLDNE